jgi:hypothetical protein
VSRSFELLEIFAANAVNGALDSTPQFKLLATLLKFHFTVSLYSDSA